MSHLLDALRDEAGRKARRAGLSLVAVLLCLLGTAFLLAAGWVALAEWRGALVANLVTGGVALGIGLLILGGLSISRARRRHRKASLTSGASVSPLALIIESAIVGFAAGRKAGGR